MDSFFPEDMPTGDRMVRFHETMEVVTGKKTPKKDLACPSLTPLERYQVRKQVLPAYGDDLRPLVAQKGTPGLHLHDGKMYWRWSKNVMFAGKVNKDDPFVSSDRVDALAAMTMLPDGGVRCAIAAYVENARCFQYGASKEKEALELTLEVNGAKYKMVAWPDMETGKLDKETKEITGGSIVAALIARNKDDKPFAVREVHVVQQPYEEQNEED